MASRSAVELITEYSSHDPRFPNVKLEPGCVISPKVMSIGSGSIIGAGTVIMEGVSIGKNTIIGPLNVIEARAKIGDNVTIGPHGVIARNTVIENNVFIGPHFSCANDRFISDSEHGTSPNKPPFKEYPIHLKEYCRLGTRVTLAPGVVIGKHAYVKMCTFVKEEIGDNEVVRP